MDTRVAASRDMAVATFGNKLYTGVKRSCYRCRVVLPLIGLLLFVVVIVIWSLPVGSDRPSYMPAPHRYDEEVDFRIIVLTYDRPESLRKCLASLAELDTLGDRVGIDVWIDRSRTDGTFDTRTWDVAEDFASSAHADRFAHVRVHVHRQHVYIIGQWLTTWRPREATRELALIVEDDIDVSPQAYVWIKAAHGYFGSWPDVAGYTIQMENVNHVGQDRYRPVSAPEADTAFLYQLIGTWGFAPHPERWRRFQDWFADVWRDPEFRPYLPGTVLNTWYLGYERSGRAYSMWEMFFIYFCHERDFYIVYSNLRAYTGREDVLLDTHRQEIGLHTNTPSPDKSSLLLKTWNPDYANFHEHVQKYRLED